jgi:DNA polymerase-1
MKKALLVDLSGIFWRNYHATVDAPIGEAFQRTVDRVTKEASHYDFVAVCEDRPPYKRKALSDAYKAQRDAPEPAAIEQFKRVKERLTKDGWCVWGAQGFEADDIIATAVHQWATKENDDPVERIHVLSSDKDLMQLVSPNVFVVSVSDGAAYGEDEVLAKWGVRPEMMRDLLALMGDKSDNVPGVPGVGPKNAAKLLHQWGDIDGLFAHVTEVNPYDGRTVEYRGTAEISRAIAVLEREIDLRQGKSAVRQIRVHTSKGL